MADTRQEIELGLSVPAGTVQVEATLARPEVHQKWEGGYRTAANARFYDVAFDRIAELLQPKPGQLMLDAGCGICDYAIRLAHRGFQVTAVDFSESVIPQARSAVAQAGLDRRIRVQREDILALSFPAASFDYVLCWGVLMHIPDIDRALDQLVRVLKPGGRLVISETNLRSVQSGILRFLRWLLGRRGHGRRAPAGIEHWAHTAAGALLTREVDVPWLVRAFASRGMRLKHRFAGQFSELYATPRLAPVSNVVHAFNALWFRFVRFAGPATGNILILERTS